MDILQDYHNKYKELEDYVKKSNPAAMGTQNSNAISETGGLIIQQKWATFSREILRLANDVRQFFIPAKMLDFQIRQKSNPRG